MKICYEKSVIFKPEYPHSSDFIWLSAGRVNGQISMMPAMMTAK